MKSRVTSQLEVTSMGRTISILPVKTALVELLRTGTISRDTDRALKGFSRAVSEACPPARILGWMERAYRGGYPEAVVDAMVYCAGHGVVAPGWVLEGWAKSERSRPNQKVGRPNREVWVNLWRVWAVGKCSHQQPYGRSRQGDKYERAARLLESTNPRLFAGLPVVGSANAIKKSYLQFKHTRKLGYISSQFMGDALRKMLLDPVIEHLSKRA
jgi:hypothetical protein